MPLMQHDASGIISYLVDRNDIFPQAIYVVSDGYVKIEEALI